MTEQKNDATTQTVTDDIKEEAGVKFVWEVQDFTPQNVVSAKAGPCAPEGLVDVDFLMNPETEDLVYGTELENGDVVLIEDHLVRGRIPKDWAEASAYDRRKVLEKNRWCTVSRLERKRSYDGQGTLIQFIGVYEDGTKMSRRYSSSYCWYKKI